MMTILPIQRAGRIWSEFGRRRKNCAIGPRTARRAPDKSAGSSLVKLWCATRTGKMIRVGGNP